MIGMLNSYFDCLVPPIERHGGEMLKFVGDGLLAIFAVAGDVGAACEVALAAAREAQLGIAAANPEGQQTGEPVQRYGMALHLGDVLYGNIGSTGRLDFTTVGPAST
jgi:adenylate cyclase